MEVVGGGRWPEILTVTLTIQPMSVHLKILPSPSQSEVSTNRQNNYNKYTLTGKW